MATTLLYTPEVLALTIDLAGYPLSSDLLLHGEARSKSCGSTITLGLDTAADGSIARIGVRCQACAIGQAATAIFAAQAVGRRPAEIEEAARTIAAWLADGGEVPPWPGLATIAAARAYPARHGAVMLPWTAALQALA